MGGVQTGLDKAKERTRGFVEENFGKAKTQKDQEETPEKGETTPQMVKEKIYPQVTASGNGGNRFEDYKKCIKDLAKELQKERKLMVNMGVAILVIVALELI